MTGSSLLARAVALMQETESEHYEPYAVALINLVLAETFEVNQRIRRFHGKEGLAGVPQIRELSEEIPYEEELALRALPLGLLCRIFAAEGNNPMLSLYKQEYASAVNECDKGRIYIETEGQHAQFFGSGRR